jgi:tetratricopeptide (TPR) repeat protein
MTLLVSQQRHWQTVLRRQQIANARRWLEQIQAADSPHQMVLKNYDNLLRALEVMLQEQATFSLAFQLIQALHTVVLGYADWERWLYYLETARSMARGLPDKTAYACLLEQCADVVFHMGDLTQAKLLYEEAGHIYEQLDDLDNHLRMLIKIAPILGRQGQIKEAVSLCQQAYDLAKISDNVWLAANAKMNLSHLQYQAQNWTVSLEAAQTACQLYQAQGQPELAAKALSNVITCWAQLAEWDKANAASDDLLAILQESGDIYTLAILKNTLGVIAYNRANYGLAEQAWQEALRLSAQMSSPVQLAGLYNNLGKVYTEMAEWEEAARMLEQAIALYQELGDTYHWANSMDNLADLYEKQGLTALCYETVATAVSALAGLEETPRVQTLLQMMQQRLPESINSEA